MKRESSQNAVQTYKLIPAHRILTSPVVRQEMLKALLRIIKAVFESEYDGYNGHPETDPHETEMCKERKVKEDLIEMSCNKFQVEI